jgi:hypothetical protein
MASIYERIIALFNEHHVKYTELEFVNLYVGFRKNDGLFGLWSVVKSYRTENKFTGCAQVAILMCHNN